MCWVASLAQSAKKFVQLWSVCLDGDPSPTYSLRSCKEGQKASWQKLSSAKLWGTQNYGFFRGAKKLF